MENRISFELKDGYLEITLFGVRNDFLSIIDSSKKIDDIVKAHNMNCLLLDARNVKYNIPLSDAFNVVKFYEKKLPLFGEINIGFVYHIDELEYVKFWESIANQRGFNFKAFTEYEEAEKWITNKIKKNEA